VSFVNYQTSSKQNRMAALMCFGKNNDKEAASADFLLLFQQLSCQKKSGDHYHGYLRTYNQPSPKKKHQHFREK